MNSQRLFRWVLPVALLGGACTSMLGIEDLHEDPKPGEGDNGGGSGGSSSGTGGSSGASGSSGKGGASGSSGSSGEAGGGGTDTGGSGGSGGSSGEAGGGGTDTGGKGGSSTGGTGGMPDMTVRGRVITTWNQPIPNVPVLIGDAETYTNADGEFEIPDVAETYDAKFVINYDAYGSIRTYGWAYLGLTRRDPTLQVYNGLTVRSGNIAVTPQNLTSSTNRTLAFALGSDDGETSYSVPLPGGYSQVGATWQGPETTAVTGHGLLYEKGSNSLPTAYYSYDDVIGALSESTKATFLLDLPDAVPALTARSVSGTVTSPTSSERTNYVFLRFQSNALMELVEHYGTTLTASFEYTVPAIDVSSLEIAAVEGDPSFGAAALVHKDRIAAGTENIDLTIPTPPQQVAPSDGLTNVNGSTIFSWSSQAHAFVWNAENIEPSSPYGGIYIVTGEKRVSIPEFGNLGFTLLPGDLYNWRVQVHGDPATVDDLADEDGFADSWAPWCDAPSNPKRGDGTFAISAGRRFTTAP
jgi:hypothetical protein